LDFAVMRHFEGDAEFSQLVGDVPEPGVKYVNDEHATGEGNHSENQLEQDDQTKIWELRIHNRFFGCGFRVIL
jgi:hypothetical protein